jgi:ligand-binding sensor domain-containing protein/two-component sensor histidine kinase
VVKKRPSSKYILVFLVLLFVLEPFLYADVTPLKFKKYTIQDGLSSNNLRKLFVDSRGFLWIATMEGINCYDGYSFKEYRYNPGDNNTISNNTIFAIDEDSKGNIWIGTNLGLNCYDPKTEKFTRYLHDSNDDNSLSHNTVTSIYAKTQDTIYIGTNGGGLNILDTRNNLFKVLTQNNDNKNTIPQNHVLFISNEENGKLWMGLGGNGFSKFDTKTSEFENYFFPKEENQQQFRSNVIRHILISPSGQLFISSYGGFHIFDPATKEYEFYHKTCDNCSGITDNSIMKSFLDQYNQLWIVSYGGGLMRYDAEKKVFLNYHQDDRSTGLDTEKILDILIHENIMWLATQDGLYKTIIPDEINVNVLGRITTKTGVDVSLENALFLGSHIFTSIGASDNLIVADYAGNVRATFQLSRFLKEWLTIHDLTSLMLDPAGKLWVGTRQNGLLCIFLTHDLTTSFQHFKANNSPGSLSHGYVTSLLFDSKDRVWVGTAAGLHILNYPDTTFTVFRASVQKPYSLHNEIIKFLFEDSEHRIWIGTEGGLGLIKNSTDTITMITHSPNDINTLSSNEPLCITEDDSGQIWVGTRQGLNVISFLQDSIITNRVNLLESIRQSAITSMVFTDNSNLWLTTTKGMVKFNYLDKQIQHLDMQPYTSHLNFRNLFYYDDISVLKVNAGENIINLNPKSFPGNGVKPKLYISQLKIFNQEIVPYPHSNDEYSNLLDKAISFTEKLYLPYSANFISFEFTAVDYESDGDINYAYRLLGLHSDWMNIGKLRYANFTYLKPGNYTLQVKAINSNGVWSDPPVELHINKDAPFWLRWWFVSLVILVLLVSIYLIHSFRVNRVLQLERIRLKLARDLHDDIGSSLTKISLFADLINTDNVNQQQQAILAKIANIGRETLKSLGEIVWHLDIRNDTMAHLLSKIQDHAYEVFKEKNMNFYISKENLDLDYRMDSIKRQHLYLICKEAINNILKHSNGNNVTFHLEKIRGRFYLSIHDDGTHKTISEKETNGYGLENMKYRAEALNGEFYVSGKKGWMIEIKKLRL